MRCIEILWISNFSEQNQRKSDFTTGEHFKGINTFTVAQRYNKKSNVFISETLGKTEPHRAIDSTFSSPQIEYNKCSPIKPANTQILHFAHSLYVTDANVRCTPLKYFTFGNPKITNSPSRLAYRIPCIFLNCSPFLPYWMSG